MRVGLTTQRPYSIELHSGQPVMLGPAMRSCRKPPRLPPRFSVGAAITHATNLFLAALVVGDSGAFAVDRVIVNRWPITNRSQDWISAGRSRHCHFAKDRSSSGTPTTVARLDNMTSDPGGPRQPAGVAKAKTSWPK